MADNKKSNRGKGAGKVQTEGPKTPGGAFPVKEPILLRKNWKKLIPDGRSFYSKEKKKIRAILLEPFKSPAPGHAQMLAGLTASNLLLALRLGGLMASGQVAPSTFQDYIRLTNSISANLMRLWTMARDGGPAEKIPSLQEYLDSLKSVSVEASSEPEPVNNPLTTDGKPRNGGA